MSYGSNGIVQKKGPEAGQYFHVLLSLCMGYETREQYMGKPEKHKRKYVSSHLMPVSHLGNTCSRHFFDNWATFFVEKDDQTTMELRKYGIRVILTLGNLSHFGNPK